MNEGFNKIEIKQEIPPPSSDKANKLTNMSKKRSNKIIKITLGIITFFILICVVLGLLIYSPVKSAIASAKTASVKAKEAYEFIKKQDVINGNEKIKATKTELELVQKNLSTISWLSSLPFVNNYYFHAVHGINAAVYAAQAGETVLEAIIPHADVLGLKGQGSFVLGSAEERIQKTVQAMDKLTPKIGEVETKLAQIRKEIDYIDIKRYPEWLVGKKFSSSFSTAKKLIDESSQSVADAKPLLETLPKLLGEPNPKKYLILFQNDKELRSTGGFITAFAIFRLEQGKILAESSEDIYQLDDTKTTRIPAPAPILKYLPLVPYWNLRDSNISPDFYMSMKNFETLYKSSTEKQDIDGIIAVDTTVLLKIMEILGPIDLYGTKFTTDTVSYCNCPQVIYELERYADQPVGYEKGSRKDLIGRLMYEIMKKSLSSSPKLYWGRLFQTGIELLNQKHILLYLHDPKAQKGIENINYAGRIKEYQGDYLHINDTNFAGAKSNMYVDHQVSQTFAKQSDGSIIKTVTIKYNNPQPPSNCNLEKGELCLNGLLRNWIRVYAPKGSTLMESKGSQVKVTNYEDLGKTVFDGFLEVRPLGSAQVSFKYKLPFAVNGNKLNLLIQKQPGTIGHKYTIDTAGKIQEFNLTTDKEIKIIL